MVMEINMVVVIIKVSDDGQQSFLLIINLITHPGNPWYRVSKTGAGPSNGAVQGRSAGVAGPVGKLDGNSAAALAGSIDKATGVASTGK